MTAPVILVTGATRGIGEAAAIELARRGAHLIIHGRSRRRVHRTVETVNRHALYAHAEGIVADLAIRRDVEALAASLLTRLPRLDVLIHNAAIVPARRQVTSDGFEMQLAVNHLAPFLLTHRLLPLLSRSAPARIVIVASQLERQGRLDFDDLQSTRAYDASRVYSTTKLANVLFAAELARRLEGTTVTANSLHPGIAGTTVLNALVGRPRWQAPWTRYSQPNPAGAIATIVWASLDPALSQVSGAFLREETISEPSEQARSVDLARRLWDASADLLSLPRSIPA